MNCIVHEVTKSQTRLSDFHFHFLFLFFFNFKFYFIFKLYITVSSSSLSLSMISDVEHIFMYFLAIWCLFKKNLLRPYAYFLIRCFWLLILNSVRLWFANIFSHSVCWLFNVSLAVQMLFSSMQSHLIFHFCSLCFCCHIQQLSYTVAQISEGPSSLFSSSSFTVSGLMFKPLIHLS